jgi:hypothetical protein
MNINEINYEELIEELLSKLKNNPNNESLTSMISKKFNIVDIDFIKEILQIVCTINIELRNEYKYDIRNWVEWKI